MFLLMITWYGTLEGIWNRIYNIHIWYWYSKSNKSINFNDFIICVVISNESVCLCEFFGGRGRVFSVKSHLNSYLPILWLKVLLGPHILRFKMFNILTLFFVDLTKDSIKLFVSKSWFYILLLLLVNGL